eukprot:6902261-Prymnesium_polylepis.1
MQWLNPDHHLRPARGGGPAVPVPGAVGRLQRHHPREALPRQHQRGARGRGARLQRRAAAPRAAGAVRAAARRAVVLERQP